MVNKSVKWLIVMLSLVFGGVTNAGIVQYSDTNVGGPLWAGLAPAHLQPFYVSTSGLYSMETIAGSFDTYLWLYAGIPVITNLDFDSPFLAANDDGGNGLLSLISDIALQSSTQYSLLTRGFSGSTGTFTAEIRGVGDITLGALPPTSVPTPPAFMLLVLGLLAMRFARRRDNV